MRDRRCYRACDITTVCVYLQRAAHVARFGLGSDDCPSGAGVFRGSPKTFDAASEPSQEGQSQRFDRYHLHVPIFFSGRFSSLLLRHK